MQSLFCVLRDMMGYIVHTKSFSNYFIIYNGDVGKKEFNRNGSGRKSLYFSTILFCEEDLPFMIM